MQNDTATLATLIGSRLCHDLISPLGAISNGLELMGFGDLSGVEPEYQLVSESCVSATARIRFFRVAFGTASGEQLLGAKEIRSTLEDVTRGGRMRVDWQPARDQVRREVQIAFLGLLCLESALPLGGTITIEQADAGWRLTAAATRISIEDWAWRLLCEPDFSAEVTPSRVQFLMLKVIAAELGRHPAYSAGDNQLVLTI